MYIGYIYRHWNVNDKGQEKTYIGQMHSIYDNKIKTPQRRWGRDGKGYAPGEGKEPTKFYNAISKYGWDNFSHDILLKIECETLDELEFWLDEWEKYYVWYYDSYYNGYNGTNGGSGSRANARTCDMHGENNPFYGKHHREETKQHLSDIFSGQKLTDKHKNKISISVKKHYENMSEDEKIELSKKRSGENNPMYGKGFEREKHPGAKKVINVETGIIFNCIEDAAEWCNYKNACGISACCKGKRNYAGKHHVTGQKLSWMYHNE